MTMPRTTCEVAEWTEASSIPGALLSMLLRLPKVKFVIVTLGKDGCIMLQRTEMDNLLLEEMDVEDVFEKLNLEKDTNATLPICISSVFSLFSYPLTYSPPSFFFFFFFSCISYYIFIWPQNVAILHAKGIGMIIGKLLVGTAESIPQTELIDTTGAGDAFIGAVLYSICANMPQEKMLPFAAQVAAIKCRTLGARAGLPHYTDPRLSPFLV
ncbi:putative receptor-like serine/threonine-protein kinase ALE2-like [Capsicum annuum]|nr:putative receptor-like serine/threonine-protein kinase ALE2-like [Capsicum annuum]